MFQTINSLSTWIIESDAGTYSHRFHQELIQRLAVSHATTPINCPCILFILLPRFTLRPMGRCEKNMEKTHKNMPKRKAKVPCQQWHQHTSKWKSTRTSTTKCPNLGEIKHTKSQSAAKLIATCGFGVSLGLGLKAERDVKAYVAPDLQPGSNYSIKLCKIISKNRAVKLLKVISTANSWVPCSGRWKDHQWSEISSRAGDTWL